MLNIFSRFHKRLAADKFSLLIKILPEKYWKIKLCAFECASGEGHILLQRVTPKRFLDKADSFILNYVTALCPKIFADNYRRQSKH